MKLFDFFKKELNPEPKERANTIVKSTVPENEKKYYRDDSYYTTKSYGGTVFERTVVTFEERKKTAIPSQRGLYPAQILLLEYCSYGTYPGPQNGYPGFWWFSYGIRDVGAALKELGNSGFIVMGTLNEAVGNLKVQELKDILSSHGESTTGKKDELVKRVQNVATDEELLNAGVVAKYRLTDIGRIELEENAYVPYMHKRPQQTIESDGAETTFNVWIINKILGSGDKSNWKAIVDAQEQKFRKEIAENHAAFMEDLKKNFPEEYKKAKAQDDLLASCKKAQAKYDEDHDIDSYISFWENIWSSGGLNFFGSNWTFKLAELYIEAKRFDDALNFVKMIKVYRPTYSGRADSYIEKIPIMKKRYLKKKK